MKKFEFKEIITNTIELNDEDLKDYLQWCNKNNKNPESKYSLIEWISVECYTSDWVIDEDIDYEIFSYDLKEWIKNND